MCEDDTSAPAPASYRPVIPLPQPEPYISLEDWKGELFWKAMDPMGHQYLCRILVRGEPEDTQLLFSVLKDQRRTLMVDPLGMYVIHYLCKVCNEEQMSQLVYSVIVDDHLLMVVCFNSEGSEAMQHFLYCLRTPKQISDMISVLQRLTAQLVNHKIGSGVISHCFSIFPVSAKETKPILDVIADIFFEMATNRIGSVVLGELLRSAFLLESRPSILARIIADILQLSHHLSGSYVVQQVIMLKMQNVEREIVAQLREHFAPMSVHKYATGVVSTLLFEYKQTLAPQIYNEIIRSPDFFRVLQDPYGKYVLKYAKKYTMKTCRQTLNH